MPRLLSLLCFSAYLYLIMSSAPEFAYNEIGLMEAYRHRQSLAENQTGVFENYVYKYFIQSPIECLSSIDKEKNKDLLFGVSFLKAITYALNPYSSLNMTRFKRAIYSWTIQANKKLTLGGETNRPFK